MSIATVSRVINEKGPVREETQRRIRRVVEKLRYAPHGAARSLIMRETQTLGVLLPDLFGEFFSELIRGIDLAARERGYHLLVSGSHGDRIETRALLRAMRGRVDGLIVLSPDVKLEALRANLPENFPLVLLNCGGKGNGFDSICIDNSGGAFAMVRHLIGLGHRRIAFVTGPPGNRDASERLRGYRRAMRELSGEWSERLEIPGNFREEAGYLSCKSILGMRPRPSAIFAANDSMAIGLLCAFREEEIPVPEDFALAGFDDIPIARFMTPPLSSVAVPIAELGAVATRRLVQRLGPAAGSERIQETIPTTLVVRSSCGAEAPLVRGMHERSPITVTTSKERIPVFQAEIATISSSNGGRYEAQNRVAATDHRAFRNHGGVDGRRADDDRDVARQRHRRNGGLASRRHGHGDQRPERL